MTCQQQVYESHWEKVYSDREEYSDYVEYLQSELESKISEKYHHVDPNIIWEYVQQSDLDEPFRSDDFEVYCAELDLIDEDQDE